MDNQNQKNTDVPYADNNGSQAPPSLSMADQPSYDSGALSSLDAGSTTNSPVVSSPMPPKKPNILVRAVKRADVVLAILLVLGSVGLIINAFANRGSEQPNSSITSQYDTVELKLDELAVGKGLEFNEQSVTINGTLQLNNGVIVSPSLQPANATAGQIYYDQDSNQLAYYNGTQFIPLGGSGSSVQSIGGIAGAITLGPGLSAAGDQISNSGVLSLQGETGDVTLLAGDGIAINGTTIGNAGVISVVSSSPNLTVTDDGNGNLTLTPSPAGTGTVTSGGGTSGRVPLFTGSQNIEDSLIMQSGLTVTVTGDLSVVTGGLSLSNALTVPNGGTGATSLAANGVIVGGGTGALSSVTAGGPNLCLISTGGAPVFAACPSGSGVTSLNGLTGALNIANASAAGVTVTIDDASTVTKGIASFNPTNFSTAGGAVNTIQNINTAATPTFAGVNTNSITPSAALTVGISAQTALLQGSTTTITSSGGNNIILNSGATIELLDNTNVTGNFSVSGDVAINGGDLTAAGALNIAPAGTLTAGLSSQTLTLQGNAATTLRATSGANTTVVAFTSPVANTTLNFPALPAGTYAICTTSGNCSGAGTTLQAAYDASSSPEIVLDATRGALTIQDNATPIGANLLEVQNNGGGTTYLAVTSAGVVITGTATVSGSINSSGGALQTGGVTRIDASGNATNIGSLTLSGAISGGTTITGSGNINTTSGVIQTASTTRIDNSGNLVNIAAITASGSATLQGGSLTLGTNAQAGTIIINDGSSNTGSLQVAPLGQNTVYTLPDPGGASATICLTTGNCAGSGGGVTGSGTNNRLAKFTSTGSIIGDSTITDNGTTVTTTGDLVIQGGDVTVGVASTQTGTINFAHSGSAFLGTVVQGALGANRIYTLPDATGTVCLDSGNCLGGGGGGANTALSNLTSVAINTTLLPGVAGTVNLGSTTLPFGDVFLAGTSGTPGTNNFRITGVSTSGTRVITLPDATGTVCLQSSSSCGFAPSTGSTNYIQNQTGSNQTADFQISGTGRAATFNGTTGINTGAVGGTQRIDASGNLVNIVALTLSGAISGGTSITGSGNINTTGGTLQTASTTRVDNSGNLLNIGTITASGSATLQGGAITLGTNVQAGTVVMSDGSSNTGTLQTAALGQNTVYTLPDPGGASATICLNIGNCAGSGTGVTTAGGTPGTLAVFTGTQDIGDSLLSQTGGTVTANGNFNLTTGNQYRINGTQISSANLSDDANLAKLGSSQTFTGNTNGFKNGADSTNAFNVQNAAGNRILTVDTTGGQVALGIGSTLDGKLVFNNVSNANMVTILPGTPSANRTLTLPNASGILCTDSGNCAGAGATLQTSYNFSVGGTTPKIKVNSTLNGVDIQDADVSIGADLFDIRASNAGGLGQVMFGVGSTGDVTIQGSDPSNSATALRLLTNGGTSVLTGDTTTGRIILGQGGTLAGTIAFSNATNTNQISLTAAVAAGARTLMLPDSGTIVCTNGGNCAGVGGSVGGTGTNNTLAKFTSTGSTIGNSTITDNGTTVSVGAILNVSGDTVLTGDLAVNGNDITSTGGLTVTTAAAGNITLNSAGTIELQDNTNVTGNFDASGTLAAGTGNAFQVSAAGAITGVGVNSGAGLIQGTAGLTISGAAVSLNNNSNFATSINTGTSNATITLGGGSAPLVIDSTAFDVTNTGAVSGVTTLATSGIITAGGVGSADTSTYLCRNSSNQIATCNGTGSGVAFLQGGNSFGAAANLGTNDANVLNFRTNNATRITLGTTGDLTWAASSAGNFDHSASSGTFSTGTGSVTLNGSTTVAAARTFTVTSGLTNLRGATSGDALNVSNSTSGGNIAQFFDNNTPILTIADTGRFLLQPNINSTTAFTVIKSSGSSSVFTVDTTNGEVEIGESNGLTGKAVFSGSGGSNTITLTGQVNPGGNRTITLPDENGTICTTGSVCTGYAPASGSGNYIQNTTSVQSTSNFYISGDGKAATSLQAPALDAIGGALGIGATNATAINIGKTGSSILTTVTGTALVKSAPASDSINAFQVQNAASSTPLFNVDTLFGRVAVGGTATVSKFEVLGGDAAIYNSGNDTKLILGDSTAPGQNGFLQWDSANDYFRIESVGTNGLKINDNFVAIGNIFPSQPLIVGNGSTSLFQINTTGVATLIGGQAADITTPDVATANGTATNLAIKAGDETSATCGTACTAGSVSLQGGNATGGAGTRNGGNVTIDGGTGSIAGSVTVGTTNAAGVTLGRAAGTTTLNGTVKVTTPGSATANSASLCRDTSTTNLTACDGTNTTGRPFLQGGNSFGAVATFGTNDANGINIRANSVTVASLSATGAATFINQANSTAGFQVQKANADVLFAVDTTGNQTVLGKLGTGGINGKLAFNTATAGNFISTFAASGSQAVSIDYVLPTAIAAAGQCMVAGSVSAPTVNLSFASCASGITLQSAYDADVDGTDAVVALTTADDSIIFRNPASSGTDSGYVISIDQLNTGAVDGLRISSLGTGALLKVTDATSTAADVFTIADTGVTTFKSQTNSATAFTVLTSGDVPLFTVDTSNSRINIGSSTGDATGIRLVLDTKNTSGDPTGVNGAIYYNTGGQNGPNTGGGNFAGKMRCFEGNVWQNCLGARDIVERRWGLVSASNTQTAAIGYGGFITTGQITSGTAATGVQAESNYLAYTTGSTNGDANGWGSVAATFPGTAATVTQARWLPKFSSRVRVGSTTANVRHWVALTSDAMTGTNPTIASGAETTAYMGLIASSAVSSGAWICGSGDGTNHSGVTTGVTMTANHYYDIIVDLSTAGTLVCSISDNGGAFTTVTKTTNLPGSSTNLGVSVNLTTLTGSARTMSIQYIYVESQ